MILNMCLIQSYHIQLNGFINQLILNATKANLVRFTPTKLSYYPIYTGKLLTEVTTLNFLGRHNDDHLKQKSDTELIFPKLCATCFTVRQLFYFLNVHALLIVYFVYFHSVIKYVIIFWKNSTHIGRGILAQKEDNQNYDGSGTQMLVQELTQEN